MRRYYPPDMGQDTWGRPPIAAREEGNWGADRVRSTQRLTILKRRDLADERPASFAAVNTAW